MNRNMIKIIYIIILCLGIISVLIISGCATPDVYHIGSLSNQNQYAEIKTEALQDTIPKILEVTRTLPDGTVVKESPSITMGSVAKRRAANPWFGGFLTMGVDSLEPNYRIYRLAPGEVELLVNYEYCHIIKEETIEDSIYNTKTKFTYQEKNFDRIIKAILEPGKRYLLIGDSSSLLSME